MFYPSFLINTYLPFYYFSKSISRKGRDLSWNFIRKKESGTEIGNSLEFDFVVPPPHSWVGL